MKYFSLMILSVVILFSCKTTTHSDVSANIAPKSETHGWFIGQLEGFLQKKAITPFANTICVEATPRDSKTNKIEFEKKVLFEVKLVFAMWLDASERHDQKTWDFLNFAVRSECDPNDLKSIAFVAIKNKTVPDENAKKLFLEPAKVKYEFKIEKNSKGVFTSEGAKFSGANVLAYAISSPISFNLKSDNEWNTAKRKKVNGVYTNNQIYWHTLDQSLLVINSSNSKKVLSAYQGLYAKKNQTYDELKKFADLLNQLKLKPAQAVGHHQKVAELKIAKLGSVEKYKDITNLKPSDSIKYDGPYNRVHSLLHVLIHEIGHLFGLAHSHETTGHPEDNVKSPLTKEQKGGLWFTKDAAGILYITLDDIAGVKASTKRAYELTKSNYYEKP